MIVVVLGDRKKIDKPVDDGPKKWCAGAALLIEK
jgi:hypothetical protein